MARLHLSFVHLFFSNCLKSFLVLETFWYEICQFYVVTLAFHGHKFMYDYSADCLSIKVKLTQKSFFSLLNCCIASRNEFRSQLLSIAQSAYPLILVNFWSLMSSRFNL